MESTIGLYKIELIDRVRSWSGRAEVERESAEWVRWFNADRLHSSIGYLSPIEYETGYREQRPTVASILEVAERSLHSIQGGYLWQPGGSYPNASSSISESAPNPSPNPESSTPSTSALDSPGMRERPSSSTDPDRQKLSDGLPSRVPRAHAVKSPTQAPRQL